MDKARIALAKAMGIHEGVPGASNTAWFGPDNKFVKRTLPNPFTDANDDYAVLEWMRRLDHGAFNETTRHDLEQWDIYCEALCDTAEHSWEYNIGDYARAACKVLDIPLITQQDLSQS